MAGKQEFKKIKAHKISEPELRQMWNELYCKETIYTFDNILVKFQEYMFDHAFFESDNRQKKDKSILSYNRLEKMLWIKDTLVSSDALIKQGWDKDRKVYDGSKRVALIKGNYIVVIRIIKPGIAKFVTAYEVLSSDNLEKIVNSPNWELNKKER